MSKGGAAEPPKAEASANIHWFTVRYGADQTQLFNLDCWGQARFHPPPHRRHGLAHRPPTHSREVAGAARPHQVAMWVRRDT